ncbi:MAG: glutathione S-transferase N-terminal domain-containing protein [Myxococcota bacterium]
MMQLHYTPTSPYARKVRVVIREKGLGDRVEEVVSSPLSDEGVPGHPLNKVPALRTEHGDWLFDSPLLCAYLDALDGKPSLSVHSTSSVSRWLAESLADGVLDRAVPHVLESRRPEREQSSYWQTRRLAAIARALQEMARVLNDAPSAFDIASISFVCTLAYVDFRLPQLAWKAAHPAMADWLAEQVERPSFAATHYG